MRKRVKKGRSMSESYCDELKVINELDSLESNKNKNKKMDDKRGKNSKNRNKSNGGKQRSLSESSDDNIGDMPVQNNLKYKSILKNRNALSECNEMSSMDDAKNFYSMSADDFGICESHDSLSESCKKTVRFSDIIKRQLFRFVIFNFLLIFIFNSNFLPCYLDQIPQFSPKRRRIKRKRLHVSVHWNVDIARVVKVKSTMMNLKKR